MSCTVKKLSIVTLMGLPGSGKSTLAGKIKASFGDCPNTLCVVLNYDEFIPLSKQAQFVNQSSLAKTVRKDFVACVHYVASNLLNKKEIVDPEAPTEVAGVSNKLMEEAQQLLKERGKECGEGGSYENGFLVVDDNNYYKSMRNDFYQVAKALECSFCVLYVKCGVKISKLRNSNRPLEVQISDLVIDEMYSRIEEPDPMNNACDLYCIQYPTDTDTGEEMDLSVKTLLQHSLLNPVIVQPPADRSEDRRICSENEIHQADIVLRKWINSQLVMSSFGGKKSTSRREYGNELKAKKALVLKKLKTGEYKILARVSQDLEFSKEIVSLAISAECNGSG